MVQQARYYDGTKLLSMKDINGEKPEIYMITSNRTDGKTTYFNRLAVNRFLRTGAKFCLLYRFGYMMDDVADKFFKNIGELFFNEYTCISEKRSKGLYHNIYLCKKDDAENRDEWMLCGYAIAINNGAKIKNFSHMFSDVESIVFDEFQAEFNDYCDQEIDKFQSIHTSIARGNGKQNRYVPVYMCANTVSVINPYFTALGISTRLNSETRFLKGEGFVLEVHFNEYASQQAENSAFNRAFSGRKYTEYQNKGIYCLDNTAFIEKKSGKNIYLCTIVDNGNKYSIREYEDGMLYVNKNVDDSFRTVFAVDVDSHGENYVLIMRNILIIKRYREYFDHGAVRFQNLECKDAFIKLIQYTAR